MGCWMRVGGAFGRTIREHSFGSEISLLGMGYLRAFLTEDVSFMAARNPFNTASSVARRKMKPACSGIRFSFC